jgi:hypothetical protein
MLSFARVLLMCGATACVSVPPYQGGDAGAGSDAGGDGGNGEIAANIIFVTSTSRAPSSFAGDLMQADAWCQQLAIDAKLPTNTYVAWLSKTNDPIDARVRAANARGWVRPDGKPVAATIDDLLAGAHWYPPRLDEMSRDLYDTDAQVATGTTATGDPFHTCGDWADGSMLLQRGAPDASSYAWTEINSGSCLASRIYCLGINKNVSVTMSSPNPATTRLAFVSAGSVTPSAGRTSFDTLCATQAGNAGLGSNFLAAVADGTSSIKSRFSGDKPWARVDGVTIFDANMTKMQAPFALDASGNRQVVDVIGGAQSFTTTGANHCNGWTSSAAMMDNGEAFRSFPRTALADTTVACNATDNHVYCLQQ